MYENKDLKHNRCPFCGKVSVKLFFTTDLKTNYKDIFCVHKCSNCYIEFIYPPKDLAKFYKDAYFSDQVLCDDIMYKLKRYIVKNCYIKNSFLSHYLCRILIKFVAGMPHAVKRGDRFLDIGCGSGDILYLIKDVGADVYGLDISEHAVKLARKHGLGNVVQGTELDISKYEDAFFTFIRVSHVLEHMVDPTAFIKLANKKLAVGGQLLIQTPNIDSLGQLFGKNAKYYSDIPRHIILFSTSSLLKILREAGFSEIRISYLSLFSDFRDNLILFLRKESPNFKGSFLEKVLGGLLFNFIFLPIDLFSGLLGRGQTLTTAAKKGEMLPNFL